MSDIYNAELQAKTRDFITANKLSQAQAALKIGINKGTMSRYLSNKPYNGDIGKLESDIEEFFKLNDEKQEQTTKAKPYIQTAPYLPTSISEDICRLIKYCHVTKGIMLVHGDAGIGKSKATIKYENENPSSTVYIESTPSTSTLRETLRLLAKGLRIPENQRNGDLSAHIKSKLKSGNKVVIIDEAQHLKFETLEEITRWGDPDRITGKPEVSIVLMGNSKIVYRMEGGQEYRYRQQSSRIKHRKEYLAVDITKEDVELLFPYLKENNLEKEIGLMLTICRSKRGIRSATNLYESVANNSELTYDKLFATAVQTDIDVLG